MPRLRVRNGGAADHRQDGGLSFVEQPARRGADLLCCAVKTLNQLLNARAQGPQRQAYVYVSENGTETASRTFQTLDIRARSVARVAQSCARLGDVALLAFRPGLEFLDGFFGALYAGLVPA